MELREHFDNVTPPGLPPDWIATNAQGPPSLWVTSASGVPILPADTLPNAAFIDDPAVVSDKLLDSISIFLPPAPLSLTFRHNFNLEASGEDPNLGFDGGVLELSTDGGNTLDILAAGGTFVIGGYNRTVSADRGSPIAGRQAWSGNSEGFVTTVVNLPIFLPIGSRLRWRMASDTTGSTRVGALIQSILLVAHRFRVPRRRRLPHLRLLLHQRPQLRLVLHQRRQLHLPPTITPRPTPTARSNVTPRWRPTPAQRPTPWWVAHASRLTLKRVNTKSPQWRRCHRQHA